MWRTHRSDLNQSPIVKDLRKRGYSVAITKNVGDDFPDLAMGGFGVTALVELKTKRYAGTAKAASELRSKGQQEFAQAWRGSGVICGYDADEVSAQFQALVRRYANILR